ncbi:MAG: oligopeptidase A [Gammaproteobacteria bacterium]|nr:oligopeptidase A [Gammaproteobacteria bacterium]|tara:strand:+ start:1623 stop:3644 length:2022 start_codon:yes stop_codon:yes gene_type:complete
MKNPLLDISTLPKFNEIKPNHVLPAIEKTISNHRQKLNNLLSDDKNQDFNSLVAPIEIMEHELNRIWSPVSHLQSVLGSKDWRQAYIKALPLLTKHSTETSQDARLQRAYSKVSSSLKKEMNNSEKSAVDQALKNFHLSGVDLAKNKKNRFKEIMQELAAVQASFEHNVQDSSDAWSLNIQDPNEILGIPQQTLERAQEDAKQKKLNGWVFNLNYPTYHAILTYADNQSLREKLYRAWATRGSDQSKDPKWDNSENIEKILALRHETATLLGFSNFAEYSLATKMAESTEQVLEFLWDLANRSVEYADKELKAIQKFAASDLQPWDVAYWLEKYKEAHFSFSNEEMRRYFPAKKTVNGLFELATKLFGVSLEQKKDIPIWHEDVCYFELKNFTGEVIGGFYTDLYARNGKRSGAWISECINRQKLNGKKEIPVGFLVCNFPPCDESGLSLLTHDDILTLFHEFGHMLHHLLTRIDIPSISGINGVPWDAVELPSQFMENFAWNYEVLKNCSSHIHTGDYLPQDLFNKLEKSRNVGSGLAMLRQLEFAIFDFSLHTEFKPEAPISVLNLIKKIRKKISLIKHPDYNRFPHAFTHIFSGGYAAGYYSYKWAEVLAADAFSAFEETGIFNEETAKRFRTEILEVGGSKDIMEAYVSFKGRKPTTNALLRQNGILTK